jgi:Domain of unknown function (DUF4129)
VLTFAAYRAHLHFHTHTRRPPAAHTGKHHGRPPHGQAAAEQTSPQFEWTVFWVALGVGILSLVPAAIAYRRWQQRKITPGPTPAEELAATIGEAIDDLEREPDPRRAVIAAYARMERELGRHGLVRQPSETAIEYLRRVLLGMSANGAAVERLTALFERAKFSPHPVTEEMRAEAIAALTEIKDGLA